MRPKYALFTGHIDSKTDGQMHFLGAAQLAALYGVAMRDCIVNLRGRSLEIALEHIERQGLIKLRPRYDGNYTLPTS